MGVKKTTASIHQDVRDELARRFPHYCVNDALRKLLGLPQHISPFSQGRRSDYALRTMEIGQELVIPWPADKSKPMRAVRWERKRSGMNLVTKPLPTGLHVTRVS